MSAKEKLESTAKIIGSLNHYQVLKITLTASASEIRDAFHREALEYHPDRYANLRDEKVLSLSKIIYGRIVEAYRELSSRSKKETYDAKLQGTSNTSVGHVSTGTSVNENEVTAPKPKAQNVSPGARFYKLALAALQQGNLTSAKMNIQIALNAEASNPDFTQLLQKIEVALKKK